MIQPTSLAANKEILVSGCRGKLQTLAWVCLQRYGPLTGLELNFKSGRNGLHKRLSELKALGLVEEHEIRACSVSGFNALTWKIVRPENQPTEKKISKRNEKRRRWFLIFRKSDNFISGKATNIESANLIQKLFDYETEIVEVREVLRK